MVVEMNYGIYHSPLLASLSVPCWYVDEQNTQMSQEWWKDTLQRCAKHHCALGSAQHQTYRNTADTLLFSGSWQFDGEDRKRENIHLFNEYYGEECPVLPTKKQSPVLLGRWGRTVRWGRAVRVSRLEAQKELIQGRQLPAKDVT